MMVSGLAEASLCHAALSPASPALTQRSTVATAETDEIVVRSTPIYELRAAVVAAEERFYARYNELNKVRDFDVECVVAPPTGTRFKQRICRTVLQLNAQSEQGYEYAKLVQDQSSADTGSVGPKGIRGAPPTTEPEAAFLARYQDYKENVLYLLKMNPDLRGLLQERLEAEKRYGAELKRRFRER
jgi:hypothetical protein